jgi:hypothetical protein
MSGRLFRRASSRASTQKSASRVLDSLQESTKGVLRFWEDQVKSMAWNTENEDGSMVRLVDKPHQVALRVVGFEDRNLSDTLGFPASKRELLDRLQVKLVVFNDRIEINGLFPIQPINIQLCTSTRGRGHRG